VSVFKAVGQGFALTHRLWFAILAVLVVTAVLGGLASALLPFGRTPDQTFQVPVKVQGTQQQVPVRVEGQGIQVPEIKTPEQFKAVAGPVLILFVLSVTSALFLLGGVLGSLSRLLQRESVAVSDFFQAGIHWFFPMLGWAISLGLLTLVLTFVVGVPLAGRLNPQVISNPQFRELAPSLPILLFRLAFLLVSGLFLFSSISLVEGKRGVWSSLRDSVKFLFRHLLGTMGLFACVVGVGVVVQLANLILAGPVNSLRGMLGIAPYAKGLPVFFFNLILGLPQAYLTVFFPSSLYAYYHANTSPKVS